MINVPLLNILTTKYPKTAFINYEAIAYMWSSHASKNATGIDRCQKDTHSEDPGKVESLQKLHQSNGSLSLAITVKTSMNYFTAT